MDQVLELGKFFQNNPIFVADVPDKRTLPKLPRSVRGIVIAGVAGVVRFNHSKMKDQSLEATVRRGIEWVVGRGFMGFGILEDKTQIPIKEYGRSHRFNNHNYSVEYPLAEYPLAGHGNTYLRGITSLDEPGIRDEWKGETSLPDPLYGRSLSSYFRSTSDKESPYTNIQRLRFEALVKEWLTRNGYSEVRWGRLDLKPEETPKDLPKVLT